MTPVQIIKYINVMHRVYWEDDLKLTCQSFGLLLKPALEELNRTQYSRLRSTNKKPSEAVLNALDHPEVQLRIQKALKCPGLFVCQSTAEVAALIARAKGSAATEPKRAEFNESLIVPSRAVHEAVPLCAAEAVLAEKLHKFLQTTHRFVGSWPDPPASGASVICHAVATQHLLPEGLKAFLAQPFGSVCTDYLSGSNVALGAEVPFESAYHSLVDSLGLAAQATPETVLDELARIKGVLFILDAVHMDASKRGSASAMARLVVAARSRSGTDRQVLVFLVGRQQEELKGLHQLRNFNEPGQQLRFGRTTPGTSEHAEEPRVRSHFFEVQWRRYCELRGMELDSESGSSRMKRVRQYYDSDAGEDAWPSTLRLNAFFASNYRTFGYFDPTGGWAKMVGMPVAQLPVDVRLHLSELILRLKPIGENKKRQHAMRAIRWCSTAVYWLTERAVEDLGAKVPPSRTEIDVFESGVKELQGLIEISSEHDEERRRGIDRTDLVVEDLFKDLRRRSRSDTFDADSLDGDESADHSAQSDPGRRRRVYRMDLVARAAVQDRWMNQDAVGRAWVHRQIATRLLHSRRDKRLLEIEYPIEPHWGGTNIHFVVEAIRHFMRSCQQAQQKPWGRGLAAEGAETLPSVPSSDWNGCNPYEVVNLCFGQLYWRVLNDNGRSRHHTKRQLALRHGAYHLTAELLELMSLDGELGKPHWALNPAYVSRYLREVGFSQLDLGDLKGAKATFEALIMRAGSDNQHPLDVVDYQLDLILVLASMDDRSAAERVLSDAKDRLAAAQDPVGKEDAKLIHQVQSRILAREAHLAYLADQHQQALALCGQLEQHSPGALVRDAAHTYISTLGALGDPRSLEMALDVCIRQLFANTSRNMQHEALGFRVALGHTLRKLERFAAAEAALDGAYEDILQFGGAERTYLATLLEAGRVLHCQGRFARAYAAYLRPCLDRARSSGYRRTAVHAYEYAVKSIEQLLADVPEVGYGDDELRAQLRGRGAYLEAKRTTNVDPRYSYSPIADERWLPRLQDRAALERELLELQALRELQ